MFLGSILFQNLTREREVVACRCMLAGHNRRRRKTQPEDTTQLLLARGSGDRNVSDNDNLNLLALLTSAKGIKLGD